MTTTQTTPTFEEAFEQVKDFGGAIYAGVRKAGDLYLDSYEKTVDRAIELQLQLAGMTEQEWLKGLIESQAGFARELTASYTTAARSLLK